MDQNETRMILKLRIILIPVENLCFTVNIFDSDWPTFTREQSKQARKCLKSFGTVSKDIFHQNKFFCYRKRGR